MCSPLSFQLKNQMANYIPLCSTPGPFPLCELNYDVHDKELLAIFEAFNDGDITSKALDFRSTWSPITGTWRDDDVESGKVLAILLPMCEIFESLKYSRSSDRWPRWSEVQSLWGNVTIVWKLQKSRGALCHGHHSWVPERKRSGSGTQWDVVCHLIFNWKDSGEHIVGSVSFDCYWGPESNG